MKNYGSGWRDVPGFEGVYSVSSDGQVRREQRGHGATIGKLLRQHRKRNGYLFVDLCDGARRSTSNVHVLVARAFLGAPPPQCEVNHIDGNKENNRIANLEYVTRRGNIVHGLRTGLYPVGERLHNARLTADNVRTIRSLRGEYSQRQLAERFGVARTTIADVLQGRTWREGPRCPD